MWYVDAAVLADPDDSSGRPYPRGLLVRDGLVREVGRPAPPGASTWSPGRAVAEAVVVPGLRDPHVHLRAAAAARCSVEVSQAGTVAGLLAALVAGARSLPAGGWLRGWGYDEAALAERRPPGADELDGVGSGRPVVLHHRTGHAAVLNHRALAAVGADAPGPAGIDPDGVERDAAGRPTGLLVDAHRLLARVPRQDGAALTAAVAALAQEWLTRGVTAVTDATATTTVEDLALLDTWVRDGLVPQDLRVLLAPGAVADAVAAGRGAVRTSRAGARPRDRSGCTVVGAKVAVAADEIGEQIGLARRHGWPVAVHVLDVDQLEAALTALRRVGPPSWGRDRLEHVSLVLPEQRERLAASGAAVVTNPAFLADRGSKYVEQLSAVELDWLYPVGSLVGSGVLVAAASDAPVSAAGPLDSARAALTREVTSGPSAGRVLAPAERVSAAQALAMVTTTAAAVDGVDARLRPGACADLVVLDRDPRRDLRQAAVLATVIGGRVLADRP